MTSGEQTVNQTMALSRVGSAHDFFQKTIRQALQTGISPEKIIDFLDGAEAQISRAVTRKIIEQEVMVEGEVDDGTADADYEPPHVTYGPETDSETDDMETADTVVIKDKDE
jgi:hypothetical protein